MSGIGIPSSLDKATTAVALTDALASVLDPAERAKIKADIKTFHALNESEAKKYEEARNLIKEHKAVLDETQRASAQNKADIQKLASDREEFEKYKQREEIALREARNAFSKEKEAVEALRQEALATISEARAKEDGVKTDRAALEKDRQKHLSDVGLLAVEAKKVEDKRQDVLAMEKDIKSKVEALRKFNV